MSTGSAGEWDEYFVANPFVYWNFGVFFLGYSARMQTPSTWRGGLAVSSNGWTYSKYGDNLWNPVLDVGPNGKFDDTHVAIRAICRIEDTFHALYAGHDGSKWQLGYLTLE
ncbi:MAG: hypothetical protein GTO24_26635 [candidate division Zixibacteria bacterium]|nr:hypothetical protein [candidate division Zixibacteria bacterium]